MFQRREQKKHTHKHETRNKMGSARIKKKRSAKEHTKNVEEKSLRKQLIFATERIIVAAQLSKVNY